MAKEIKWSDLTKPESAANSGYGVWGPGYSKSFDGEKNYGEIGPIVKYFLDHTGLRHRSWQAYLTSDIAKTVIDRYLTWIIDKGLKLTCHPSKDVLVSENIDVDTEKFNKIVESRFQLFSKSKYSDFSSMRSLNKIAKNAFKNAKIGGDVLVILRVINGNVKVQLVDGAHLCSPIGQINSGTGNRIIDGVELDQEGKHIAYYINKVDGGFDTVQAWSDSTGLRMAFLVYGSEYRLDNVRGLPMISACLETIRKIDRYKEAAVGSAEERQKIVYAIEHAIGSSGESPLADRIATMMEINIPTGDVIPIDISGNAMANTVAASTNKQTFNMPIGSKMTALESRNEMYFKEFYETQQNIICGAVGIPPNVAFSIYNDSFSASRAATKDWEHTMDVDRNDFQTQFYDPIFALWLHIEILKGKINAPGYLVSFNQGNWMVTEAYLNARFTGPMFPHIDPLKEVKAERDKLGSLAQHIPLTTIEQATENLMSGESQSNMEQFARELEEAEGYGLENPDLILLNPTLPVGS